MADPDADPGKGNPTRLDVELVRRGLAASRTQARAAIEAGNVKVDGAVAARPGQLVGEDAAIDWTPAHPWVSRGGLKLSHGLEVFGVDPAGRACLDVGASTGGFTEVLLAKGARRVVAVDVGRGQLHPRLAGDPRVTSFESTDARDLSAERLGEPPSLVVCDASFIGLAKLLGRPLSLTAPDADLVTLFKPQFEVGPAHVGKGGIVSDHAAADRAVAAFEAWLGEQGWMVCGRADSPILGGDGNRERLIHARRQR
jgi:23S rRNA (cytidine1920-2'-O)/16S rRNA (cytidine1409-2'-O)-methyltransferase